MFVSHKLGEVIELCDRVTVLRDGHNAYADEPIDGRSRWSLARRLGLVTDLAERRAVLPFVQRLQMTLTFCWLPPDRFCTGWR